MNNDKSTPAREILKPYSQAQVTNIVTNILESCKEITRLSVDGYHWIRLRAGFIAHNNREGFIADYGSSQHLHSNILAYEHANIHCNRPMDDPEYPYYKQQCDIYSSIVRHLKENPAVYRPKLQTDDFYIDLDWYPDVDLHRITLCSTNGTVKVFTDKQFLLSLASNIHSHLQDSDTLQPKRHALQLQPPNGLLGRR